MRNSVRTLACGAMFMLAGSANAVLPAVAIGKNHIQVLKSDSTVWGMGKNDQFQLGTHVLGNWVYILSGGTTEYRSHNTPLPLKAVMVGGVRQIAAGDDFSIAVDDNGMMWGWGKNDKGQLGDSTKISRYVPYPSLTNIASVSAGSAHSMAVMNDGRVKVWGDNTYGQLGDGTNLTRTSPNDVNNGNVTNIVAVAAGGNHSLALRADGTVWAWGRNDFGQVGNASFSNAFSPVQVQGLTNITAIAAGGNHSLALKADGTVWAWGDNAKYQLGNLFNTPSNIPMIVPTLIDVTAIAAGTDHNVVLKKNGSVWAWGSNESQQLEGYFHGTTGGAGSNRYAPVLIWKNANMTRIYAGYSNSCAVRDTDNTGFCWGKNTDGQTGSSMFLDSNRACVQVQNPRTYVFGSGTPSVTTTYCDPMPWPAYCSIGIAFAYGQTNGCAIAGTYLINDSITSAPKGLTATASGAFSNTTLNVTFTPPAAYVGVNTSIYVIGIMNGIYLNMTTFSQQNPQFGFHSEVSAKPFTDASQIKPFVTQAFTGATTIPIYFGDVSYVNSNIVQYAHAAVVPDSMLNGLEIFVGYGTSTTDMLQKGNYARVYTFQ